MNPATSFTPWHRWLPRSSGPTALPALHDSHPDHNPIVAVSRRLETIPVSAIRGTALEGPVRRGSDFLPLPALRTRDWEARWQRLVRAGHELVALPPIEVIHAAGGYWVTDGHDRVALARSIGQLDIDAVVAEPRLSARDGRMPTSDAEALARLAEERALLRAVTRRAAAGPRHSREGVTGPDAAHPMIDQHRALELIERAEREPRFCDCGAPTVLVERPGGVWLECSSLSTPAEGRIGRLVSAVTATLHTRRLIVDYVALAA